MSAIEKKIDELYSGPLPEFTKARNALAKTFTGADAARVKSLAKPSVVPWAINQVYWHARPVFERVMKAGEQLRRAQIAALEGKHADVRAATSAHRAAVADGVKEAERLAADAGSRPTADALARTFEALSLSPERGAPGRLTDALQPSGFEALAGISAGRRENSEVRTEKLELRTAEKEKKDKAAGARKNADADRDERAARAREAALAREHESAIKKAEAALARAQSAERLAHEAWLRSQRDVDEVRQRLVQLKSQR
jgi:hypothetical protein